MHSSLSRPRLAPPPPRPPLALPAALLAAAFLSTSAAWPAHWTLVQFGPSGAATALPYPGWNEILRHPTRTAYVDPDGDPAHAGLACVPGLTEAQPTFYGVRGSTPISFAVGQKIVVAFYNRSDEYIYPAARVSFADPDTPDPAEPDLPWYTLHNLDYEPEGSWVPPHTVFELSYYISNDAMVNAIGGPPAQGAHTLVNVSLPYNDPHLVLLRIEISDECDLTPPTPPVALRAEPFATTSHVGQNLVRLTWLPSTDPAPHPEGISRYFIYRNEALYDLVDPAMVGHLGTNLYYVDLNVAPNTTYTYHVSAVDRAPYGLYPQGDRRSSRFGNESPLSPPVTIRTPPWSSTRLPNPWTDFRYLGTFRLPSTPNEDWAYAAEGLTYCPTGNPGHDPALELPGSLYGFTSLRSGIAELNIPIPSLALDPASLPTARTLQPNTNLWPLIYDGSSTPSGGSDMKVAGLAYHPAAHGVPARLYYSVCNFYATDPAAPSHGWFDLDLTEGQGAWFLGALPPNNLYPGLISRYLAALPADWANLHLGGRSLLAGNTILSGGLENSAGPTLYAFAPWESGALPPPGAALPVTLLLRYAFIAETEHRVLNWRLDATAEGAAWISAGPKAALAFSARRTVGDVWYGDSLGNSHAAYDIPEPPFGYKGGSCTEWRNGLLLYNPEDLAAVARGEKAAWEPQPYLVFDTQQFSRRASPEAPESGAIAFAPELQTLFYLEHNGDPELVSGLIHAWQLATPTLPVLRFTLSLPTAQIAWNTAPDGRPYQLEHTPQLAPPSWTPVGPAHLGDGTDQTEIVTVNPLGADYFRVVVGP